jgi:hypothetical protein
MSVFYRRDLVTDQKLEKRLETEADLVGGKIPLSQLPNQTPSLGDFTISGSTMSSNERITITNESSDEDMRIRAGDDLYLESHGDDLFIRSADDVRIQTNYNFSEGEYDNEWEFASDGTLYLSKNSFESRTYLSTPINDTATSLEITAGRDIYLKTAGYDNDGQGGSTSLTFKFDDEGAITFPDGTIQTTALKNGTGEWTLATGSNTVSFTVDWNNTYVMWVRGNIPNGIIVWNATVSVTNANVPIVGTHYAWNYNSGTTEEPVYVLALTSIPAQIIGTPGTISTALPSVGTTANTFAFTINNASGSTQTIQYGWTKV